MSKSLESLLVELNERCSLPYEMNYDNNWKVKHPVLRISKNELREIPQKLAKKYKYGYIFGTPGGSFKNNSVDVELSNFSKKYVKTATKFFKEICKEIEKVSGWKVTYRIKYETGYFGDEPEVRFMPDPETGRDFRGRSREDFEYTEVIMHLMFNDK